MSNLLEDLPRNTASLDYDVNSYSSHNLLFFFFYENDFNIKQKQNNIDNLQSFKFCLTSTCIMTEKTIQVHYKLKFVFARKNVCLPRPTNCSHR